MGFHLPSLPWGMKLFWDKWNIRGAILFSLFLQVVLIMVGPIRKSARQSWVVLLIWFAYLLADSAANYAVGLISNSQRNISHRDKSDSNSNLLAFWAPFLLLHLGGPDTITAFSLEDNQLWLRHLIGLGFQAGAVIYVFVQSLPNDDLWIHTVLMFSAGLIKYVERTRALYLASLDRFRDSMLQEPDPGPNYAKLMEEYASKREAELPTHITMTPEPDKETRVSAVPPKEGTLNDLEVVHYAYHYFKTFKGLVVDLIFSFRERDESRDFFNRRTPQDALRVLEVELNFLYATLYTKVQVVHAKIGYIFRFLAFGSVLVTLGLFYFKKSKYSGVDIAITYTLLLGAIALDVISFLMLIFSDRFIATYIKKPELPHNWRLRPVAAIFSCFLAFKKPKWRPCQCPACHSPELVSQNVSVTSVVFRRWSGSISTHNLIRYCLASKTTRIHEFHSCFLTKILCFWRRNAENGRNKGCIKEYVNVIPSLRFCFRPWKCPFKDFVDSFLYVSSEPFTEELWEFIFKELQGKSEFADTPETAKRISSARGDWVLQDAHPDPSNRNPDPDLSKLLVYVSDVPYDESLLLWHIATDLCYHHDHANKINEAKEYRHRDFSKILSDYMLYLLIFQPTMMSAVAGIGKIRYRDTCAEAEMFFKRRSLGPNRDKDACKEILMVNTDVEPESLKGDRSKSVLFKASRLAKELNRGENKWVLISRVWVELVSYAASHCRANTHAQQLSKGGELITFFWLLMAHFGLGEQFQINEGHARAKLIVGK